MVGAGLVVFCGYQILTGKEEQLVKRAVESLAASIGSSPELSPKLKKLKSMTDLEDFVAELDMQYVTDDLKATDAMSP